MGSMDGSIRKFCAIGALVTLDVALIALLVAASLVNGVIACAYL